MALDWTPNFTGSEFGLLDSQWSPTGLNWEVSVLGSRSVAPTTSETVVSGNGNFNYIIFAVSKADYKVGGNGGQSVNLVDASGFFSVSVKQSGVAFEVEPTLNGVVGANIPAVNPVIFFTIGAFENGILGFEGQIHSIALTDFDTPSNSILIRTIITSSTMPTETSIVNELTGLEVGTYTLDGVEPYVLSDRPQFVPTTTKLIPEDISGIVTGALLGAEAKNDIVTGALLGAEAKSDILTGDLLASEAKNDIVTGDLLTASALPPTDDFSLNYARIGYDNTLVNGTGVADNDNIGSANMLTPSTYDKWRPGTNGLAILTGTSQTCDYVGIAAHNMGSDGVTLIVKVSNGGAKTEVYNQLVTDDKALFIRFAEGTYDRVELTVTGGAATEIGVVFLGLELEMMRPIFAGHKPSILNSTDVMTPQMSDGGQFLGKQIVRQGFATSADFKHLTDDWYRSIFQPFVEHAKTRPYFWAWNLQESPGDIVYGWTNGNISPSYMGIRNWLEVSFNIEAHG